MIEKRYVYEEETNIREKDIEQKKEKQRMKEQNNYDDVICKSRYSYHYKSLVNVISFLLLQV